MQPRACRAFRRFSKKHFAIVSILAPYHSLQIPYISIQYPKMRSNMYLLKEKQRCLVRFFVRDFSRQNGWKIQVKPTCRLHRKLPISFPDVYVPLYILPAHHSVQTFRSVYYSMRFFVGKIPDRGRAILLHYEFSLKNDLILNGGIFTNILMLQDNVKYLLCKIGC
jgi:hypothetical protein